MISILIRNKNEAKLLEKTLLGIKQQSFNHEYEIVLVDDNSSDNSVEIAKKYGCKIVKLDKKFTYGYAINFGVKHCKNEVILLLSSHNILLSNDIFQKLLMYFDNKSIAGVRCTPVANTKQIEQSLIAPIYINKENYNHETDWSNLLIANCSAIRKSVAEKITFNETIRSNEEKLWSLDVIEKDYQILSNVPCYYIYNKRNTSKAEIRDCISKYQIDGKVPLSIGKFLFFFFKLFPWAIKIAMKKWWSNVVMNFNLVLIKFKFNKGTYK